MAVFSYGCTIFAILSTYIANPDNEIAKRFCPQNARGIKPFMERIIFAMPPFCIIFIIFCICSN